MSSKKSDLLPGSISEKLGLTHGEFMEAGLTAWAAALCGAFGGAAGAVLGVALEVTKVVPQTSEPALWGLAAGAILGLVAGKAVRIW